MKSYWWQWLVFSFVCLYSRGDGRPIISNLISKVGRGFQRAVSSFMGTKPVNSSNVTKDIPISDDDSTSSKNESDPELEKLSEEDIMVELRKVADSDSDFSLKAKELLQNMSSGKSLYQALNSAEKNVNSSRTQVKCGGGGGFLTIFFMLFQRMFSMSSSLAQRRQAGGDSMSSSSSSSAYSSLPWIYRLFRMRPRQPPVQVTEHTEKTDVQTVPVKPTTTSTTIVEDYVYDDNGKPVLVGRRPLDTMVTETPTIPTATVPVPPNVVRRVTTETRTGPVLPDQRPVLGTPPIVGASIPPTTVRSVERRVPPTVLNTSIDQPPIPTPGTVTESRRVTMPPTVIPTENRPLSPNPGTVLTRTSERVIPPNPSTDTIIDTSPRPPDLPNPPTTDFTTFSGPTRFWTETRTIRSPETPSTPTLPGAISQIFDEVNRTPPETSTVPGNVVRWMSTRTRPGQPQIPEEPPNVRQTITQERPVINSQPFPSQEQPRGFGIFQRNDEPAQNAELRYDPAQNVYYAVPAGRSNTNR